jgi:hypothetical protein
MGSVPNSVAYAQHALEYPVYQTLVRAQHPVGRGAGGTGQVIDIQELQAKKTLARFPLRGS